MYNPTKWIDHVADADTGEIIQEGTDQSAAHFNNMEQGISDAHLALALMQIFSAQNSARVLEATLTANNDHRSFKWPDGFTANNSIVLPAVVHVTNGGSTVNQYFSDTKLQQNSISLSPSEISVAATVEDNETLNVKLLLFRYK